MTNHRNHYLNVVQRRHKDQCHSPMMFTLYGFYNFFDTKKKTTLCCTWEEGIVTKPQVYLQ